MGDRDIGDFEEAEVEYDPITARYHLTFDPAQLERPSMVVVDLLSHLTEEPPLSLPQLGQAVDVDSLNSWLSSPHGQQREIEVTFKYAGYRITVNQPGDIWAEATDTVQDAADEIN